MPNYEPTPRRFSIISVSRSASRRNSIDNATHLKPVQDRPSIQDSSPIDLVGALRHLQHVPPEMEEERGRTRQIGGDNATKATGRNEGAVTAPFAKRENSASTRERIVMWEERSRSQSKGRSKSRGRDIGSRHRISVVPEVPELSAAFAAIKPCGMPTNNLEDDDDGTAVESKMDEAVAWDSERPTTPVRQTRGQPLTPDTTPRPPLPTRHGNPANSSGHEKHQRAAAEEVFGGGTKARVERTTPATPPSRANTEPAPAVILPLTPQATPERSTREVHGEEHDVHGPGGWNTQSTTGSGYTAVFQPGRQGHQAAEQGRVTTQPPTHYHLPPGLLSDEPPRGQQEQSPAPASRIPPKRSAAPLNKGLPDQNEQPRYHNVWRINSYQPDFPLANQPSHHEAIPDPGQPRFVGSPLQELPRGQLPAEPKDLREAAGAPYPLSRPTELGGGDWVVNIPPSPSAAYLVEDQGTGTRTATSRSRAGTEQYNNRSEIRRHEWDAPPVIERALHAASVSMIQGLNVPVGVYRGLRDMYYPSPGRPNIIKAYPIRRRLPIRIFFPSHHDLTSPALLPTLFTIHGGAFTVGSPADDDEWNRTFADSYTILVIALNYAKAPWAAFPAPLRDVEALYHATLNDESLPIDRMRVALAGFDAGANLALALSQLPSVKTGIDPNPPPPPAGPHIHNIHPRSNPPPTALISITALLDFTMPPALKLRTRPYKPSLRGPRGWGPALDWTARLLPSSAWSYIPYGHDAADPLLSPAFAARADLPPHVFVVAAELDCLAMESWRAACRWGGDGRRARVVPGWGDRVGREGVARWRGCLDDGGMGDGARFAWCEVHGGGSTRWLLVPDVVHGFDSAGWRNKYLWGDEVARMDAEMKTVAYQREVAEWLWGVVWGRGGGG